MAKACRTRVTWVGKLEPFTLSYHCEAYMFCGNGCITFLLCHTTSCDHMINGACDLVSAGPLT